MGLLGVIILMVACMTLLRAWLQSAASAVAATPKPGVDPSEGARSTRDENNPYAPPDAPVSPPEVAPSGVIAPPEAPGPSGESVQGLEFHRQLRGALEGLGEALPLGAQAGWSFGPPPPAAELEPVNEHKVSLSAEELARLIPPF